MADGPYRFQPGTGQYYFPPQPRQFSQRPTSPINSSRYPYSQDAPSPTRSPSRHSPPHSSFTMYNHNPQTSQNVFMNSNYAHGRFGGLQMNTSKHFQGSQHHQPHQPQAHRQQQQDHTAHASFANHQQTSSNSGFSANTPHFAPSQLRNGTPAQNGIDRQQHNEHWTQQLALYQTSRESTSTHSHARNLNLNKTASSGEAESGKKDSDPQERSRAVIPHLDAEQHWQHLDLGGQGLRALSPVLFRYDFLTKLFLNANNLEYLPPSIGKLKNLEELDLSLNNLTFLPPEMGMLVNLKTLLLFDNRLQEIPFELGSLFKIEMLGIHGNPLSDWYKQIAMHDGSKALITAMRETLRDYPRPLDREWLKIDESKAHAVAEKFTVMTYNTLCDRAATQAQYGYAPSFHLAWDYRKSLILEQLRESEADIMCLQEIDQENYNEFFRRELSEQGYRGFYCPKTKARTMGDHEAKQVDGCATFWKDEKFILLDKQLIDIAYTAINRPDMKGEHDVFNRVMPRDDIATVTFLENRQSGVRFIVVNVHIFWNPLYADVKLIQSAVLMERVSEIAEAYSKHPPCKDKAPFRHAKGDVDGITAEAEPAPEPKPSMHYSNGTQIPLIVCGDFNSVPDSGVHELLSTGSISGSHADLADYRYGNFTRDGMAHPFTLKSSYGNIGELPFTNYTPNFSGVLGYIWYSTPQLQVTKLLGPVDEDYIQRVPGFPNAHYPSDHIMLLSEFVVKQKKERNVIEADFGPQRSDRDRGYHK